jgi:hypothetical protein
VSTDVQIRCVCPGLAGEVRHPDGDTVRLRDKLGFRQVEAIRQEVGIFALAEPEAGLSDSLAIFAEGYILHGIESWTLEEDDDKGRRVLIDPSRANIRRYIMEDMETADIVSTAADSLYASAVLLPLLSRAFPSSPDTPTESSTSPSRPSGGKRPKPSKPSSTTTTQTAAIGRITSLHGGDSNSSPSSESAA